MMRECRDSQICCVCGSPARYLSHISPDSYLRERRDGARIIRDEHPYCSNDYHRILDVFWKRVGRHLV